MIFSLVPIKLSCASSAFLLPSLLPLPQILVAVQCGDVTAACMLPVTAEPGSGQGRGPEWRRLQGSGVRSAVGSAGQCQERGPPLFATPRVLFGVAGERSRGRKEREVVPRRNRGAFPVALYGRPGSQAEPRRQLPGARCSRSAGPGARGLLLLPPCPSTAASIWARLCPPLLPPAQRGLPSPAPLMPRQTLPLSHGERHPMSFLRPARLSAGKAASGATAPSTRPPVPPAACPVSPGAFRWRCSPGAPCTQRRSRTDG